MGRYLFFCLQLKRERLKRGWSQQDIADRVGSSGKTVARWEKGETLPRPYHRQRLAELFERSAEELGLGLEDTEAVPLSQSDQLSSPPSLSDSLALLRSANPAISIPQNISPSKGTYHKILGYPSPTHPRMIQQRERAVEALYMKLIQPDVTAIVLTGIAGVGKSTLAALIYQSILERFKAGIGYFTAEPIWLTMNRDVTIADVIGTLFEILGKSLPDLENLSPYNQGAILFHALSVETQTRLIVLDQFENVLNWQNGYVSNVYPGFGEWLDIINSQPCMCKVLFTSRFWPRGTREYPSTYMQEYPVEGLSVAEGIELLKKQGVEARQANTSQLENAVVRCEGHAFALTLLASLFRRNRNLSLSLLFGNTSYEKLWQGNIARNLLDFIYLEQLDKRQRELLFVFSIYRKGVPLEACMLFIDDNDQELELQLLMALDMLLAQHIVQTSGNDLYHLHAIVADYVQERYRRENGATGRRGLLDAHARAAQYYLQQSVVHCPPLEQRKHVSDVQPLIEAAWHLCKAEQQQEAYDLIRREELYMSLRRWGRSIILLELYLLLQRFDKWSTSTDQEAEIQDHLGRIYSLLGEKEKALHYYTHALNRYQSTRNRLGEGRTLNHLGLIQESHGAILEAKQFHEQALDIALELGDRKGEADSLSGLGWIYHRLGQQEIALSYCEQALDIHRTIGNQKGVGDTFNCLGLIYFEQGQKEQAQRCYDQSLSIRREIGDRGGEGKTLNHLGLFYADARQEQKACSYYKQSLSIRREIGDRNGEGVVFSNLGKLYVTSRCYDGALACLLLAHKIFKEMRSIRYKDVERRIEMLQNTIGHQSFDLLHAQIEPEVQLFVERALAEELQEPVQGQ